MKLELKNVKINHRLSEETFNFSASVYIDGVRKGEVMNRGCGGCNDYHPRSLEDEVNRYAATLPHIDLMGDGQMIAQNDEIVIGEMLNRHLKDADFKKHCKKSLIARLPGDAKGEWSKFKCEFNPQTAAALRKRHGEGVVILNEALGTPKWEELLFED